MCRVVALGVESLCRGGSHRETTSPNKWRSHAQDMRVCIVLLRQIDSFFPWTRTSTGSTTSLAQSTAVLQAIWRSLNVRRRLCDCESGTDYWKAAHPRCNSEADYDVRCCVRVSLSQIAHVHAGAPSLGDKGSRLEQSFVTHMMECDCLPKCEKILDEWLYLLAPSLV